MGSIMKTIIYTPLYNVLIFFFVFVRDMGVSVILLTVLVRVLLIKQSIKAEKSRLALQKLQPEIKKIQKQNKDNKEKQTKEMLELYKKRGVSPFSSCLPTLFQFPFLIGLFVVFKEGLKNGFPLYGPVQSLVSDVTISSTAFGFLDLTAAPNKGLLLALPIIATALQFIQSKMMMATKGGSSSGTPAVNKSLMYLMPGMTFVFTLSLPSTMSLYWIATTLFAIAQQRIIDYEIEKHPEALVKK